MLLLLNLLKASGLIYAAALYLAILAIQTIANNNRLQYAVIQCKTQIRHQNHY